SSPITKTDGSLRISLAIASTIARAIVRLRVAGLAWVMVVISVRSGKNGGEGIFELGKIARAREGERFGDSGGAFGFNRLDLALAHTRARVIGRFGRQFTLWSIGLHVAREMARESARFELDERRAFAGARAPHGFSHRIENGDRIVPRHVNPGNSIGGGTK